MLKEIVIFVACYFIGSINSTKVTIYSLRLLFAEKFLGITLIKSKTLSIKFFIHCVSTVMDGLKIILPVILLSKYQYSLHFVYFSLLALILGSHFPLHSYFNGHDSIIMTIVSLCVIDWKLTILVIITMITTFLRFGYKSLAIFTGVSLILLKMMIFGIVHLMFNGAIDYYRLLTLSIISVLVIIKYRHRLLDIISGKAKKHDFKKQSLLYLIVN